jgi:hypothetical protein
MRLIKYLFLSLAAVMLFGSCRKIQQLPPEPYIEFISFTVFDTTDILDNDSKGGRLKIYFEDGDGNLGLKSAESEQEDTTNLFLTLYRKTDGEMVQVPDDDLMKPSAYRIPYMERTGNNKILKGTITVALLYIFYDPADNDTIMYDVNIKDRDGNLSNTVSTSEIALSVNNVYKNPE